MSPSRMRKGPKKLRHTRTSLEVAGRPRGLVSMTYSPSVRINPPLTIREDTALAGLAILDEALEAVVRDHGLQ